MILAQGGVAYCPERARQYALRKLAELSERAKAS